MIARMVEYHGGQVVGRKFWDLPATPARGGGAEASNGNTVTATTSAQVPKLGSSDANSGVLFPNELILYRNGVRQPNLYPFNASLVGKGGRCTCSPPSPSDIASSSYSYSDKRCCKRMVVFTHKMGHVISRTVGLATNGTIAMVESCDACRNLVVQKVLPILPPLRVRKSEPHTDFRVMMLMRNIYASLVSGYNYHKGSDGRKGQECGLRWNKRYLWTSLSFQPDPPRFSNGTGICEYLQKVPVEVGMRVYIGTFRDAITRKMGPF